MVENADADDASKDMGIGEGRLSPSNGRPGDKDKLLSPLAAAPRPKLSDDKLKLPLQLPLPPNSNGLMMEVWASVASWFFRPDAPGHPNFPPAPGSGSLSALRSAARPPNLRSGDVPRHFPMAPTICTAIRCTVPGCSCECFSPGKTYVRFCETCSHGWVPHALDKLGWKHLYGQTPVEPVQPNVAFDIASLVLYGTQALPIRLKILLDRLFSVLQRDEVLQVLHGFGWTHEDYARGYILQEPHGGVLERWNICSPEEEPLVLQQFLRFGETRAITQQLLLAQADQAAAAAAAAAATNHPTDKERERERDREREERDHQLIMQHQYKIESELKRSKPKSEQEERKAPERGRSPTLSNSHSSPQPSSPREKQAPLNLKQPIQNGPTTSMSSPPSLASSPLSVSPLNRLQSMQPFDFRKISGTNDVTRRRASENTESGNVNSPSWHLPPPLPLTPNTSSIPVNLSHQSLMSNSAMGGFPSLGDRKSPVIKAEKNACSEFGSDEDDDDDDRYSALNLSRDVSGKSGRRHSQQARKGGMPPMKRGWGSSSGLPLNLGTQLINPATGKKRVQCNVCLKTFCDKGALKIHFSAVHLREMHKCTVEGCNMMFSSRRSRNRHSANPNPKLHSPHLRRKISPHDGRSSQSHPLLIPPHSALTLPGAGINPLSFGAFPLLTPPPELRHQTSAMDLKQSLDLTLGKYDDRRPDTNYQSSDDGAINSADYMDDDDDYEGIVVVGDEEEEKTSDEDVKRIKISMSDADEADSNEDSLSVVDNQSVKEEAAADGPPKTKRDRKRKNQNPTKCSLPVRMAHNDGMSTDDESRECDNRQKEDGDGKRDDRGDPLQQLQTFSHNRFGKRRRECDRNSPTSSIDRERGEKNVPSSPARSACSSGSNDTMEGYPPKRNDREAKRLSTEKQLHNNTAFPPDFISRLYSEQLGYPMNGERLPLPFSGLGFAGLPYPFLSNGIDGKEPSRSSTPSSPVSAALSDVELPTPDRDGRLPCRYCTMPCADVSTLRDHISTNHSSELYRCSAIGCNKVFMSRATRNRHAEQHDQKKDRQLCDYDGLRSGSAGSASSGDNAT